MLCATELAANWQFTHHTADSWNCCRIKLPHRCRANMLVLGNIGRTFSATPTSLLIASVIDLHSPVEDTGHNERT